MKRNLVNKGLRNKAKEDSHSRKPTAFANSQPLEDKLIHTLTEDLLKISKGQIDIYQRSQVINETVHLGYKRHYVDGNRLQVFTNNYAITYVWDDDRKVVYIERATRVEE